MKKRVGSRKSNHKLVYILSGIIALILLGFGVYSSVTTTIIAPNPGHTSNQIFINYTGYSGITGSCYISLQTAVDKGYINYWTPTISQSDCTTLPTNTAYALAKNVLITIGGTTMTLKEAMDSHSIYGTVRGSSFTSTLDSYENASQINMSISGVYTTLQNAVNQGDITCTPTTTCAAGNSGDSCGTISDNGCGSSLTCNCGSGLSCYPSTGTGTCISSTSCLITGCSSNYNCDSSTGSCVFSKAGQSCYPSGTDTSCVNAGTYDSSGNCVGYSYVLQATSCGSGSFCNGAGLCQTWSGTGCGSCPFGSYTDSPNADTNLTNCYLTNSAATLNPNENPFGRWNRPSWYSSGGWTSWTSVIFSDSVVCHASQDYVYYCYTGGSGPTYCPANHAADTQWQGNSPGAP